MAATAIVGGTVIDTVGGATTENAAVVISGDRIVEAGPAARVRVPADAARIDARGAWLIPGLTDMHAHVRSPELLPLFLAHGVTAIRDIGGNLARGQLLRADLAAGRRVGPRLAIAGNILDGIPPLWPDISILVDTPERAEAAVRFLAAAGVDVIKVYNSVPERSLETIVRTAHTLGLPVTGHVPRAITMTRAIELGMDGLEHVRVTGREMLPADEAARIDFLPVRRREAMLWERFDLAWPQFDRLIERLAASGAYLDPTFVVDFAPLRTPEDSARDEDMSRYPAWIGEALGRSAAVRSTQTHAFQRVMETPPEILAAAGEGFRKRQRFIARCAEAGVRIVSGTDHWGPGEDLPGRGLQRELGYLTECGLTPLRALQTSTIAAARALGREADLGAIEAGKLADIVMLDRDPLQDIRNVSAVRTVIHGGRIATPSELIAAPPAEPATPYAA
jgi:imidazolonepropionase-like amidohydrolase